MSSLGGPPSGVEIDFRFKGMVTLRDMMFEHVADLDIGKKLLTVGVRRLGPISGRYSVTRMFRTMTR